MIASIIIFLFCLLLSAFFSGSEMAFVSANRLKLRQMADAGNNGARKAMELQKIPQRFLTGVLIGNSIVNIVATAIVTYWLEESFGVENEWLVTAVLAPILIVFGETVPKDYCRLRSQQVLIQFSGLLDFLLKCFHWPIEWILKGVDLFFGLLGTQLHKSIFVSEREFRMLIEETAKHGVLDHHEKKLIDTILDFESIDVESVMIPVDKSAKVEISATIREAKEVARRTHSPMILVYEEIPTLIVGMIYVFDILFEESEGQGLKKYLRSPIFLLRNTSIEKAFLTLQEKRQSFAVVTDRFGEVIGVVAIEKLFALG